LKFVEETKNEKIIFVLVNRIDSLDFVGFRRGNRYSRNHRYSSKQTDWRTPDTTVGNTTQLATRNAANNDCKKSWLQFDLTSLYAEDSSIMGNITNAKLTFYGAKSESSAKGYALSGLNDAAALENWVASALTWNNGPGNNIATGNTLDATKTTSLYTATIPVPVLDVVSETPAENRAALTTFLNTDTDGKITFIFTAGSTTYLWNVGQPLEPVLTLTYMLGNNPKKTHNPIPADEAVVNTGMASLSWTNPDPNDTGGIITCDVYLGTDPNRLTMDNVPLAAGVTSIAVNTANFPTYGSLTNNTRYYWAVDCNDSSREPELITGETWTFFVGQRPSVDAGPDQTVWLDPNEVTVNLDGTTSDDGSYTVLWTQVSNGAPAVTISPNNTDDTSITLTARGDYEFMLTADDGNLQSSDTVRIVVGDDACDASHISTGDPYDAGDQNQDCIVDLQDFMALIIADWLECTDTLDNCGN